MKSLTWSLLIPFLLAVIACEKPTVEAELAFAPNVPAPLDRGRTHQALLQINGLHPGPVLDRAAGLPALN